MNPNAGSSREDERVSMYSRQSAAVAGQPHTGSGYGYSRAPSAIGVTVIPDYYMMSRPGTPGTLVPPGDPRYSMVGSIGVPPLAPYAPHASAGLARESLESAAVHGTRLSVAPAGMPLAMIRPQSPAVASSGSHSFAAPAPLQQQLGPRSSVVLDMCHRPLSSLVVPPLPGSIPPLASAIGTPSDAQIVDAIRRILSASDLRVMTKKKIRQQLAQELGADLAARKDFIGTTIDRLLTGQM
ncbi:hypothetical protein H4R19_002833 [Coemansia spiralis]|nr:hypothetical protein H4R19_002833 [Coemansia spiralis]